MLIWGITLIVLFLKALHSGVTVDQIHDLTAIDKWFLYKLKHITAMEQLLGQYNRWESDYYIQTLITDINRQNCTPLVHETLIN